MKINWKSLSFKFARLAIFTTIFLVNGYSDPENN